MLAKVPRNPGSKAAFIDRRNPNVIIEDEDQDQIVEAADRMIADHNTFFTFPYHLQQITNPWSYDPLEQAHWPWRHYDERHIHADDTPKDVKIVWEINRFKDLPTLAQAAYITKDERYAKEIERRLLSWIEGNPFAVTINWASALELGIRLISWTTSLRILVLAGFDIARNPAIQRSVYEQASYLAADLSTDKVVRTNHLIGEVAGLFVTASFWSYPEAEAHRRVARILLEKEILRQTYDDGTTREASSWYHQFVTDLFDLAARVATSDQEPFSNGFNSRLVGMKSYSASLRSPDKALIRYGDCDDGYALFFEGQSENWKQLAFGEIRSNSPQKEQFTGSAILHRQTSTLFVRGGEFGMGGAGFASHAHDDLLSPILWLEGAPVLADPGTFVYNGDPEARRSYRGADAHNGVIVRSWPHPKQRLNFGWHSVRPPATLAIDGDGVIGRYGESSDFSRNLTLNENSLTILDEFRSQLPAEWRLHLHPMWSPVQQEANVFTFTNPEERQLRVTLDPRLNSRAQEYNFSPSYRVSEKALCLVAEHAQASGKYMFEFSLL